MSGEIKPCPFCGGKGVNMSVMYNPQLAEAMKPAYSVVCRKCGAKGPARSTEDGAIDGWNTRMEGGAR